MTERTSAPGEARASNLRRYVPLMVGNAAIILVIGWLGPFQLGLGVMVLAALVSVLIYNGALFFGGRLNRSRTRKRR